MKNTSPQELSADYIQREVKLLTDAAQILVRKGFSASHEYPNFVAVKMADGAQYTFGTVNGPIGYQIWDANDMPIGGDTLEELPITDELRPSVVAKFMETVIAKRHACPGSK